MSIWMSSIYVNSTTVEKLNDYTPVITDETWKELNSYAQKLDLHHLKCVYFAANCIFNVFQCKDVLENEIPLLRNQNLSSKAKEVVDGVEYALTDILNSGAHSYLLFEGD